MDETTVGDDALLARVLAGDDDALSHLYARHADVVFGLARRVTRDEDAARDVTQDVFVHLWESPDRVDLERGSLRAYLATMAHRRAVDHVRRSERRRREVMTAPPHEDGPETTVVEAAGAHWRRLRLADGLAALPTEQRSALLLAYFDGLTYRQVADAQGIPEGTAKSRLRLALTRLRGMLEDEKVAI